MLLTEQEVGDLWRLPENYGKPLVFARAIEATVIEKIKVQGPVAWLHCERKDSDVVTDAVKHVWGKAVVGSLTLYDIPLYRLPEGD